MRVQVFLRPLAPILLVLTIVAGCLPPPAGPAAAVKILHPTGVSTAAFGEWVTLDARVVDAKGTTLATDAVSWSSDVSGALGIGRTKKLRLQPGLHTLTASHVTGAGALLSAKATLVVGGYGGRPWWETVAALAEMSGATDLLAGAPSDPAATIGLPPIAIAGYEGLLAQAFGTPLHVPPTFEAILEANPTDVNASLGSGRLTAGISRSGNLTVLRWPGPSGLDHVAHRAADRTKPFFGAAPNQGSFAALRYVTFAGGAGLTLLHGPDWVRTQHYLEDTSAVLVTEFVHPALGLKVTAHDFVIPEKDLLARHFAVERGTLSPVASATLVYYENLDPCTDRFARVPYSDWLLDAFNDFAAAWSPAHEAVLHFRPAKADYAKLPAWKAGPDPVATADATFGKGVYFALGADPTPAGHQVGYDLKPDAHPTGLDPLTDALDGALSGNGSSAARAAAGLAFPLDWSEGGAEAVTVYFAAAAEGKKALALLDEARAAAWTAHLETTKTWWHAWIAKAVLPATADPAVKSLARRGLIALRTAIDDETGAIVASIASQPPYAFDWPRDGSFLNRVLEIAGYPELAGRHNRFYASVQRKDGLFGGTMEMNYAADGTPGGPVLFEIDNAALAVWSMAEHTKLLSGSAKAEYLAEVYPAIKRGATFLTYWTDPVSGLPLPANEDDTPALTQGLQGAVAVWMALKAAIPVGEAMGEDAGLVSAWTVRRDTLEAAIWTKFHDPASDTLGTIVGPYPAVRGPTWAVWPAGFFATEGAAPLAPHAAALRATLDPFLAGTPGDYLYNAEQVHALAHAWKDEPAKLAELAAILDYVTAHVATKDTRHFGEMYRKKAGSPDYLPLNDIPHIWEHAIYYLAARAIYGPGF